MPTIRIQITPPVKNTTAAVTEDAERLEAVTPVDSAEWYNYTGPKTNFKVGNVEVPLTPGTDFGVLEQDGGKALLFFHGVSNPLAVTNTVVKKLLTRAAPFAEDWPNLVPGQRVAVRFDLDEENGSFRYFYGFISTVAKDSASVQFDDGDEADIELDALVPVIKLDESAAPVTRDKLVVTTKSMHEVYGKSKKALKYTVLTLRALWRYVNYTLFKSKLREVPILLLRSGKQTFHGMFTHAGTRAIKYEFTLGNSAADYLFNTMVHEMVHHQVVEVERVAGGPAHGPEFQKWASKVMSVLGTRLTEFGTLEQDAEFQIQPTGKRLNVVLRMEKDKRTLGAYISTTDTARTVYSEIMESAVRIKDKGTYILLQVDDARITKLMKGIRSARSNDWVYLEDQYVQLLLQHGRVLERS